MTKRKIEDLVAETLIPIVEKNSFELVDVEFVKEGANWYLRIYIDKPQGISIDDCEKVSKELGKKLDEIDPIKQSYFLEVSSPGLERPLKKEQDFDKYKGTTVEVKLFRAIDGKKVFKGELIGLIEGNVAIETDDGAMQFNKNEVSIVRRVISF